MMMTVNPLLATVVVDEFNVAVNMPLDLTVILATAKQSYVRMALTDSEKSLLVVGFLLAQGVFAPQQASLPLKVAIVAIAATSLVLLVYILAIISIMIVADGKSLPALLLRTSIQLILLQLQLLALTKFQLAIVQTILLHQHLLILPESIVLYRHGVIGVRVPSAVAEVLKPSVALLLHSLRLTVSHALL